MRARTVSGMQSAVVAAPPLVRPAERRLTLDLSFPRRIARLLDAALRISADINAQTPQRQRDLALLWVRGLD